MEEILASIRRIISDDQPPQPETPKPVAIVPAAEAAQPPAVSEEEDVLDLTSPVQAPQAVVEEPSPAPAPPMAVQEAPEPVAVQPAYSPPVYIPPPAPEPATSEMLISQVTNAAVSSSFGTLAHTVLSQNARTIDDVVKDMLRPMLKTWLDDNLPVIVERLVRAEIERVARGGR